MVYSYFLYCEEDSLASQSVRGRSSERIISEFIWGFESTTEDADEYGPLRFLGLRLNSGGHHLCWEFEPRSKKTLLLFDSALEECKERYCHVVPRRRHQNIMDLHNERKLRTPGCSTPEAGFNERTVLSVSKGLLHMIKTDRTKARERPHMFAVFALL